MSRKEINKSTSSEENEATTAFEQETRFQRTIGYKCTEIDNELVIMDQLTDRSFQLNKTGVLIWELLCEEKKLIEVAQKFAEHYHVGIKESYSICHDLAKELFEKRLISKHENTNSK